jgi:hypothetical protein
MRTQGGTLCYPLQRPRRAFLVALCGHHVSFEDLSRLIGQMMRDGAPFDTGGGLTSCLCNWNVEDFSSRRRSVVWRF